MKSLDERIAERKAQAEEAAGAVEINHREVHQAAAEAAVAAADAEAGVESAPLAAHEGNEGLQEAVEGKKPAAKKTAPFPKK